MSWLKVVWQTITFRSDCCGAKIKTWGDKGFCRKCGKRDF